MGRQNHPLTKADQAHGATGKCFCCQGRSDAFWFGELYVEICRVCATEVLPALIADAILPEGSLDTLIAERELPKIEKTFWKAVASGVAHNARTEQNRLLPANDDENALRG